MDLNNDDIESINILKGSAATALYSTANFLAGVVNLTKKGSKSPMQVSFTSQVGVDMLSTTIDLQVNLLKGLEGVTATLLQVTLDLGDHVCLD